MYIFKTGTLKFPKFPAFFFFFRKLNYVSLKQKSIQNNTAHRIQQSSPQTHLSLFFHLTQGSFQDIYKYFIALCNEYLCHNPLTVNSNQITTLSALLQRNTFAMSNKTPFFFSRLMENHCTYLPTLYMVTGISHRLNFKISINSFKKQFIKLPRSVIIFNAFEKKCVIKNQFQLRFYILI